MQLFLCFTQFGGRSYCWNFDKIRDTAPLRTNKGFVNNKNYATFSGIVHFTVAGGNKAILPVLLCQSFHLFLC